MKKILCLIVIISHLIIISGYDLYAQVPTEFKVVEVTDKYFSMNGGTPAGVVLDDYYAVVIKENGGNRIIAKGKVVNVSTLVSVLQIIDLEEGMKIQAGYSVLPLTDSAEKSLRETEESQKLLRESETKEFSSASVGKQVEYYNTGYLAAGREYTGGGALGGGFAAGLFLGLIGWVIGAVIVANSDVQVPYRHIVSLEDKELIGFTEGYKDAVKSKRSSKFNIGAAAGTITLVGIYLLAVQD